MPTGKHSANALLIVSAVLAASLLPLAVSANEPAPATAPAPAEAAAVEALDLARRFAEAIRNDENDRGRSLARVADAWLERGDPDRAAAVLAEGERGHWAVVAAMCDVSAEWAARGETEKARAWVTEARRRTDDLRGTARDRALLRLAGALAALGEHEIVAAMFGRFEQLRDYRGEALAQRALALARAGRADEALAALDGIGADHFYDSRVWRARGYTLLARRVARDADRFAPALQRAWEAARDVPDHQQFALRLDVVEAWNALGRADEARARFAELAASLPAEDAAPHLLAPLLARCAATAGRIGDPARARSLLERVERLIPALLVIEQPELLALAAEGWRAMGEPDTARERVLRAVAAARALVNPRPRALAGLAIALSLERDGASGPGVFEALRELAGTFGT